MPSAVKYKKMTRDKDEFADIQV